MGGKVLLKAVSLQTKSSYAADEKKRNLTHKEMHIEIQLPLLVWCLWRIELRIIWTPTREASIYSVGEEMEKQLNDK